MLTSLLQNLTTHELDANVPKLARDQAALREIDEMIRRQPTTHTLLLGDARNLPTLSDESIHLVITSPPYWNLKDYPRRDGQLGLVQDYESFLDEVDKCWKECFRVLVRGGRLVIVVGDVLLSRREHKRHQVIPLHADIQIRCRKIGFDNLAAIFWYKIANAAYEAKGNGAGFLGKPYEPNAIVKHDIEYILMERKPGSYRSPDPMTRLLSIIPADKHAVWFKQVWEDVKGESTRKHPAPFPEELADRIIRMFSFVGDTVLDPFVGTGTSMVAAGHAGRNSIGVEVEPQYWELSAERLKHTFSTLDARTVIQLKRST